MAGEKGAVVSTVCDLCKASFGYLVCNLAFCRANPQNGCQLHECMQISSVDI